MNVITKKKTHLLFKITLSALQNGVYLNFGKVRTFPEKSFKMEWLINSKLTLSNKSHNKQKNKIN